jgi:hypothetical protein
MKVRLNRIVVFNVESVIAQTPHTMLIQIKDRPAKEGAICVPSSAAEIIFNECELEGAGG